MKIILLEDVSKLGKKYDIKDVNSGHAQNFLIPKGLAVAATGEALKRVKLQKIESEKENDVQNKLMIKNLESLNGITLGVSGKANEKGHLFAGFHREDLAKELENQLHISINPLWIALEHPIKEIGETSIEVKAPDKSVKFKLIISKNK